MAVSIHQEPAYLDFVEVHILVSIIELQQGTVSSNYQLSAPWQHGCSTLLHPLAWQSVGVPSDSVDGEHKLHIHRTCSECSGKVYCWKAWLAMYVVPL